MLETVSLLLLLVAANSTCVFQPSKSSEQVAYRDRGARCEGVRERNYANQPQMRVQGFFYSEPKLNMAENGVNFIKIYSDKIADPTQLILRARTGRGVAFDYFMDRRIQSSGYRWPNDLLRRASSYLQSEDVAALACTESCSLSRTTTLLPVSISGDGKAQPRYPFLLVRIPANFRAAKVRLLSGSGAQTVFDRRGIFSSSNLQFVSLAGVAKGTYSLELSGTISQKGGKLNSVTPIVKIEVP